MPCYSLAGGGTVSLFEEEAMTLCVAKKVAHYLRNTRAVSALEYAILIGMIAVAISTALVAFSGNITTVVTAVGTKVQGASVDKGVPQ